MSENDRDSVEVPIELRFRKVGPKKERSRQLCCDKDPSPERLRFDVPLSLWSESHFYAGLSVDASPVGLFVATYRPAQPAESVILFVEIFGEQIEIEGVVRWVRVACEYAPPGVGVALCHLTPHARMLIDAFCAARPPIYYALENEDDSGTQNEMPIARVLSIDVGRSWCPCGRRGEKGTGIRSWCFPS